jgi:IS4 transposase
MFDKEAFDRLVAFCPEATMARMVLENALPPHVVDEVFEQSRERQYERKVLLSSIVAMLSLVVCRVKPSVHSAIVAIGEKIGASVTAVYDKLNHTEPQISAALVHAAYQRMAPIVKELDACRPPLIEGYRTRILDGNHLAATEHRLEVLRHIAAGALPGVALVVYDRELGLIRQVYLDEDAYTQERVMVLETLSDVEKGELWIADRNFCTSAVLHQLHADGAAFIIRKHSQNVRFHVTGKETKQGETSTGIVYEQPIEIEDDFGNTFAARRVCVKLFEPTRDGDMELVLFSNLPKSVSAVEIAEAYRKRWDLETTFNHMDRMFAGEIKALGNPRAALAVFCVAAIAFNVISVVLASIRAEHGAAKVDQEVSPYYIGVYVRSDWNGLHLLWTPEEWTDLFAHLEPEEMALHLRSFARKLDLRRMPRKPRGPKKPMPDRLSSSHQPHVSTARLLADAKRQK